MACSASAPLEGDAENIRASIEPQDIDVVSAKAAERSPVVAWNRQLLLAIQRQPVPPTVVARSLSLLHEAMLLSMVTIAGEPSAFLADPAVKTSRELPLPKGAPVEEAVRAAIDATSLTVLSAVFPASAQAFQDFAAQRRQASPPIMGAHEAEAIGQSVARQVLVGRSGDGSNALGDLRQPNYSDYSNYTPVNSVDHVADVNHWQPQWLAPGKSQFFVTAQWGRVKTRVLRSADQFRPAPPPDIRSAEMTEDVDEVVGFSGRLTSEQKMKSEYWENNLRAPWIQFAHWISYRRKFSLSQDVKMFYALSETLHDAIIAVFEAKRYYDYVRPDTAIRELRADRTMTAWAGPGQDAATVKGKDWRPFIFTPPAPEYPSGHSTIGHAAAVVLSEFNGSDGFNAFVSIPARSSKIEPTLPEMDLRIEWSSFSKTAAQSADSRRQGGIHFRHGDQAGRKLGGEIASFSLDALRDRLKW